MRGLLFEELPRSRKSIKRMHVVDAGDSGFKDHPLWYRFECSHCGYDEQGCYNKKELSITEAKKGIRCPKCNESEG